MIDRRRRESGTTRRTRGAAGVLAMALLLCGAVACKEDAESGGSGPVCQAGRHGPFATQDTAWQRWREAQDDGFAVSNGVFPCYDGSGTRGYCFNVFCD